MMKEKSKKMFLKIISIIFMTILLTCCKTHQSVTEKSTVITKDTMAISQVAAKDSTFLKAKIDSIIIEVYAIDQDELANNAHNGPNRKVSSYQKRYDISQKEKGSIKKTKIYGVSLSNSRLSIVDSLYKNMTLHATTKSEIKQKTPIQTTAGDKKVYALIALAIILFVGYMNWKNAVQ